MDFFIQMDKKIGLSIVYNIYIVGSVVTSSKF